MKRAATPLFGSRRAQAAAPKPRSHWGWAVCGAVVGAAIATAVWAPARWLALGLNVATQGKVQLVNPRGTVWDGSAGFALASSTQGGAAVALPGRMSWALRPRLTGLTGAIDLPCCAASPVSFSLQRGNGAMQLVWKDSSTQWPATLLVGLGAPWNTLKPEGTLTLRTQALVLGLHTDRLTISGKATLDATDMSSSLATVRPMGSYRLALAGGPTPSLLLTTIEGALLMNGSGAWNGRSMRFSGEASAAPGSENALSNLLNIIGRRDGARSIINLS